MKFFVIIKEHSVRIPRKNFLQLGDYPLWKHLVLKLKEYDVYIDTNSLEVLHACEAFEWVSAYKRKKRHIELENSNDFKVSPALLMIERFLSMYVEDKDEIIVTPHVTSPFIEVKTILKATQKLSEGYDSVQACTMHQEFAYFKNSPINFDVNVIQKTQDLEPIVLGNGAFFIFTKRTFEKNKHRTGKNPYFYPLSFKESIEIDYIEDYELALKFI